MATLQPEIWSLIIGYLKRDPPPSYRKATWRDLHQQDLTSISLVSIDVHNLAVPHLYTSVLIKGLPDLVRHVELPNFPVNPNIIPKKRRLARIRHLRITTFGPARGPAWTIPGLINATHHWSVVGERPSDATERAQCESQSEYNDIEDTLRPYFCGHSKLNVPMLDAIEIGQSYTSGWDLDGHHSAYIPGSTRRQRSETRRNLSKLLIGLKPRYICAQTSWSPYVPRAESIVRAEDIIAICFHHTTPLNYIPITVCTGTINRHYCAPAFNYASESPSHTHDFVGFNNVRSLVELAASACDTPGSAVKKGQSKTLVDLVGLCTPMAVVGLAGEKTQTTGGPLTTFDEKEKGRALLLVDIAGKIMSKRLRDELHSRWHQIFSITSWKKTPPCEACGWTKKDYGV